MSLSRLPANCMLCTAQVNEIHHKKKKIKKRREVLFLDVFSSSLVVNVVILDEWIFFPSEAKSSMDMGCARILPFYGVGKVEHSSVWTNPTIEQLRWGNAERFCLHVKTTGEFAKAMFGYTRSNFNFQGHFSWIHLTRLWNYLNAQNQNWPEKLFNEVDHCLWLCSREWILVIFDLYPYWDKSSWFLSLTFNIVERTRILQDPAWSLSSELNLLCAAPLNCGRASKCC